MPIDSINLIDDAEGVLIAAQAISGTGGGMTLTVPALTGVFSAGTASLTQGAVTVSGLAAACTPNADGVTTRVVITLSAAQAIQFTTGTVTGIVTPSGGAAIAFLATLQAFPILLAVSRNGVYEVGQGETRVGVPFYLPAVYLPGLTGAALRLRPLISGVPFLPNPAAAMQGKALALDGLYPAQSPAGSPATVPFLRLDFPPGWGQPDLPAGSWLAEALLTYEADGAYPSGRVAVVPLYPDDGATTNGAANGITAGGASQAFPYTAQEAVLLITPDPTAVTSPVAPITPVTGTAPPAPSLLTILASQSTAIADLRSQLMAFLNNAPTGTEPIVAVTATVTLTLPAVNTVYKVAPVSNTILTLPATTGSGRRLFFDLGTLGAFTFGLALSGSDAYQGGATPASLYTSGSSFAVRDLAAGVWAIE